jgi:hypothetical protein
MRAGIAILCATLLFAGACSRQPDDGDRLISQIIEARATIEARHASEGQLTYRPSAPGAYVIVLTPPGALTKEVLAAMELPAEARQFLKPEANTQVPAGPLFGLVRPNSLDWRQLKDVASLSQVLYVWKRAGEDTTMTLKIRDGQTEIEAVR